MAVAAIATCMLSAEGELTVNQKKGQRGCSALPYLAEAPCSMTHQAEGNHRCNAGPAWPGGPGSMPVIMCSSVRAGIKGLAVLAWSVVSWLPCTGGSSRLDHRRGLARAVPCGQLHLCLASSCLCPLLPPGITMHCYYITLIMVVPHVY